MPRITQTLTILRKPSGDMDRYGNPVEYPVAEWKRTEWPVYGVAPAVQEEEFAGGRQTVSRGLRIFAPLNGPAPGVDDLVEVPSVGGDPFSVIGEIARWEKNPTVRVTRHRGIEVRLERKRR